MIKSVALFTLARLGIVLPSESDFDCLDSLIAEFNTPLNGKVQS